MTTLTLAPPKPKLYYGWVMVSTLAVTETISWGILYYAFSIFMLPMQHDLGWSRAAMTGAFSLALLMNGLVGIGIGRLLDRQGARWLMTLGSIAATCLVLGWSQVASLPALYLIWAGIGITMAAVLYEPAFAVIATWFIQKRGRALTLLTFIGGLASVIFIPLSNHLIQTYDWRTALVILATILGAITIPLHFLILRRQPSDLGLLPDGAAPGEAYDLLRASERHIRPKQAMRHSTFWWLTAAFMLSTLAGVALSIHLTPFLVDKGYSATFAASIAGGVGLMSLPGRIIFTWLGDYLPRRWVTAFVFALQPAGFLAMLSVPGTNGIYLGVALFGFAFGAITPARAGLVAEYYGSASYGSISSLIAFFTTFSRAVAPVSAGLIRDAADSYTPVLWVLLFISILSAMAVPLAKPLPHPLGVVRKLD